MNRINGRNRHDGPAVVSAVTGMSTDKASAFFRRLSQSTDNPRCRVRFVHDYEMTRCLSEHGYRLEETVTPYDGRDIASYAGIVRGSGGLHVCLTKKVRARNAHWIVLECKADDDAVYMADSAHRKPVLIPLVYAKDRVLRAYLVTPCENAVIERVIERRRWTEAEDALIRKAADWNAYDGLTDEAKQYNNRLREVADKIDRTYASVRVRASRIRAVSYTIKQQMRVDE